MPQLRGRRWYGKEIVEFIQHPGETLYLPANMAHVMYSLDETVAVGQKTLSIDSLKDIPSFIMNSMRMKLQEHEW